MKVLVTGAAGFIGSNIANTLAANGTEVFATDNLFLGKTENLNRDIKFLKIDVLDKASLEKLCHAERFDYIINLAAYSSVGMYYPDPTKGLEISTIGFSNVIECVRKFGVKKLVYASTSSLYSRVKPPHKETANVQAGSFYELGKMLNEETARLFNEQYGINSVGLRYFAVYGPNETHKGKYANNITQFLWEMLQGRSPVLYGDGAQTRDFTFVSDAVNATLLAMKSDFHGVLNIGTGKAHSLNEIVQIINRHLGTNIKPEYAPNPLKNYVKDTLADITLARSKIGYEPKVAVDEGISRLVNFYK